MYYVIEQKRHWFSWVDNGIYRRCDTKVYADKFCEWSNRVSKIWHTRKRYYVIHKDDYNRRIMA